MCVPGGIKKASGHGPGQPAPAGVRARCPPGPSQPQPFGNSVTHELLVASGFKYGKINCARK